MRLNYCILLIVIMVIESCARPTTNDATTERNNEGNNTSSVMTYNVIYNGNGNTGGTVPSDKTAYASGASATILGNTGALAKQVLTIISQTRSAALSILFFWDGAPLRGPRPRTTPPATLSP